jgi:putative component of toxin-antitoxin plasmid stabilization module
MTWSRVEVFNECFDAGRSEAKQDKRLTKWVSGTMGDLSDVRESGSSALMPSNAGGRALSSADYGKNQRRKHKTTWDKRLVKRASGTMGDLSDVRASRSSALMPSNAGGWALSSADYGKNQRRKHKTMWDKRLVKRVSGMMGDLSDIRASRSSAPIPINKERWVVERSRVSTLEMEAQDNVG